MATSSYLARLQQLASTCVHLLYTGEERVGERIRSRERCFFFNSHSTPALLSVREFSAAQAEVLKNMKKVFVLLQCISSTVYIMFVNHVQRDSERETRFCRIP